MNNVTCTISDNRVDIFRDGEYIGKVELGTNDEPILILYADGNFRQNVSFNDLDIIQDNWNFFLDKELRKKNIDN